jgi:very-short-patch-repair endonuclease
MLPEPVLELLRRQHGAIADWQLRTPDLDTSDRRCVHRSPELERVTPRVARHRAAAPSVEQALTVAVLDAGPAATLWGKSAASHWGFARHRRLPAHVAVPRRQRVRGVRPAQLHVVRSLDASDITTHVDVPVSRPERTLLWQAGMYTHRFGHEIAMRRTAWELDQAWRQRLVDGRELHALVERSGGKGRSGIVVMRTLLIERGPDYRPAGSALEERFEEIVPRHVAAQLDRQVTVDAEVAIRTVDFRLRTWPLVVEVNGEAFHSSLTDRAADEERYARLQELGFSIVVFWEHDIWHDAPTVAAAMQHLFDHPDELPALHRPTPAPWWL